MLDYIIHFTQMTSNFYCKHSLQSKYQLLSNKAHIWATLSGSEMWPKAYSMRGCFLLACWQCVSKDILVICWELGISNYWFLILLEGGFVFQYKYVICICTVIRIIFFQLWSVKLTLFIDLLWRINLITSIKANNMIKLKQIN